MSNEAPEITDEESRLLRCIGQVMAAIAKTVTDLRPQLQQTYGLSEWQVGLALTSALAINATIGAKTAMAVDFSDLENIDRKILELIRKSNAMEISSDG